jgi:cobalt-zinc-cadmium efflux system outer membrane protein
MAPTRHESSVRRGAERRLRRHFGPLFTLTLLTATPMTASLLAAQSPPTRAAAGDTLRVSLRDARTAALRANPELRAARLDTAIARGQLRQSGILRYNPSVDVLAGVGSNGAEPGVSQELEVFGQRRTRLSASRAGVERARAEVANAARLTIGDVDRAFYRLAAAVRRNELADEVLQLNQRLASVAERQLAAGEISRLDLNLALVELGRSRSRALSTRREREQVGVELGRLLGMTPRSIVLPVVDSTQHVPAADTTTTIPRDVVSVSERALALDVDSLTTRALARRPDLVAQSAAVRQATGEVRVARREALPNLLLRAASEPNNAGSGRVLRPGVGITLPFFNRNQGEVQALRAAAEQAELGRLALVTRVRAEITSAVTTYQSAATEVEVLETTVLTPARQNRRLLETAYREGKVGLPVLLLIRNQVIDAELDYWASWLEEREALSALAEATGQNLEEAP